MDTRTLSAQTTTRKVDCKNRSIKASLAQSKPTLGEKLEKTSLSRKSSVPKRALDYLLYEESSSRRTWSAHSTGIKRTLKTPSPRQVPEMNQSSKRIEDMAKVKPVTPESSVNQTAPS
jgi:hypothetical protein